ncbi:MAG: ROK family protein [Planctomycetes bacterium]|nr:ROK family protein [Planctomycetota bacterium]
MSTPNPKDDTMSSDTKDLFAGIDIGGTKIYTVITDANGKICGTGRKKTKADKLDFAGVIERTVDCVHDACGNAGIALSDLKAAGVGAPSPILPDGTAVNAPNMGWENVPLVKTLEKALGLPVFAENDCNAGTLGEYYLGGGKGSKSLIGLFMGTGLGGGIIYRGELITGENCMAAEIGHMIVVEGGRRCGCGHFGCLEAYASKTGMGNKFAHEIIFQGRESMLKEKCGKSLSNVRSSILKEAYIKKDEVVVETLNEAAHFLGLGIGNMITLLAPDKVVVGGGVFEALGKELLPLVQKSAKAVTHPPASFKDTKIVLATLGDDAVALGAMVYARECIKKGHK